MLSIIICTFKRPDLLANVLGDIEAAAICAPVGWELIVVDNDGDARVKKICDQSLLKSDQLKYFHEPKVGLSLARNRAVSEASGHWLLFLDDDLRFDAEFVSDMLAAIDNHDVGVICPRMITPIQENWPRWLKIRVRSGIGQFDLGESKTELNETTKIPVGACMCLDRNVYDRFGPFSENIGRTGSKLYGGEETLLFTQAFDSAIKGVYLPSIVVHHEFILGKSTKNYWRRQGFYGGRSFVRMQELRSGRRTAKWQIFKLAAESLLKSIARAAVILLNHKNSFENEYRAIAHFGRVYEALSLLVPTYRQERKNGR